KNQSTEPLKMSLAQLHEKARRRESKARFQASYSIGLGIVLCVLFAFTLRSAHELNLRLGFGILSLWCLYYAIQSWRWLWPARTTSGDASLSTTVESYRAQLEKQRDLVAH